jgi:DoxX-like family
MHLTFTILTTVFAVIMFASAIYDFVGSDDLTALMTRLGYAAGFEKRLGLIKLAGALGLVGVYVSRPLAEVAAACFVVYFALAVRAHRTAGDPPKEFVPAVVLFLVIVATVLVGAFAL